MPKSNPDRLERFSFSERAIHWMAALSFLYAGLTGLALWSHKLFWLSSVFGGGVTVRAWHPWGGILFSLTLGFMFWNWARQMRLDSDDRKWLRQAHRYAVNDESGLPESGRFNAGQKMLFWVQSILTLFLFFSGVVLWWPMLMPRWLSLAAILIHPAAAVLSLAAIIVHIYMGTAAVPGAFRSMIHGWVGPRWAESHHPKWYRDISKR